MFLLKFKKPVEQVMIQYKSIIFPDKKPYRINLDINIFSKNTNEINATQFDKCILMTIIYPFFEKQYLIDKNIELNIQNEKKIIAEINNFSKKYQIICKNISIYLDPNGFSFFSPYNNFLTRKYIDDIIHKKI